MVPSGDQKETSKNRKEKAADQIVTPHITKPGNNNNEKINSWQYSPKPWDDPVNGAELLDEIRNTFNRHLVLPEHAAEALPPWILHTYCFGLGNVSTYLALLSPEKRCGKTTALSIASKLCHRPLTTSNVSPAAVYRVIEKYSPTFLIDETDTFLAGKDELHGILNSGYNRESAFTIRCVGDHHEPKQFNVFGPKLFAGIGQLPKTLSDRCIIVPMRRKHPNEKVERLRGDLDVSVLRRKCMRWTIDNQLEISQADPEVPLELDDRAADIWRPLIAIADIAGDHWPITAHKASIALSAQREDDESLSVILLKDIRDYMDLEDLSRVKTEDLLRHLNSLEERPWGTFHNGREMTPRLLSERMKSFGIKSSTIRFDDGLRKGYQHEDMLDAFARYTE